MPTIATLIENNTLIQIHVDLERGVQPWRCLYGTTEFLSWINEVLPGLNTTIPGDSWTPEDQVFDAFDRFIAGKSLDDSRRFKSLNSTPQYFVWEFKTPDIRIFGWFPQKDHFICAYGIMKETLELERAYGKYIAMTKYVRDNQLCLEPPGFINSRKYEDVLSDEN